MKGIHIYYKILSINSLALQILKFLKLNSKVYYNFTLKSHLNLWRSSKIWHKFYI